MFECLSKRDLIPKSDPNNISFQNAFGIQILIPWQFSITWVFTKERCAFRDWDLGMSTKVPLQDILFLSCWSYMFKKLVAPYWNRFPTKTIASGLIVLELSCGREESFDIIQVSKRFVMEWKRDPVDKSHLMTLPYYYLLSILKSAYLTGGPKIWPPLLHCLSEIKSVLN